MARLWALLHAQFGATTGPMLAVQLASYWLGFGLISDGTAIPHRLRVRGPSFINLQATHTMAKGGYVSDLIAIIGSIDIVLGEVDR